MSVRVIQPARLALSRDDQVRNITERMWYLLDNTHACLGRALCSAETVAHVMRCALDVMSVRELDAMHNEKGEGLLWTAVCHGHTAFVDALLAAGVSVNTPTWRGSLPLTGALTAVGPATPHIVKALIEHGADVNAADAWGNTPLFLAVMACATDEGHVDVVRMLLAHGANVNSGAAGGRTPLHAAVFICRFDIVKTLLTHGANVGVCAVVTTCEEEGAWVCEWSGLTPLGLARAKVCGSAAYTPLIDALVDAGGVE